VLGRAGGELLESVSIESDYRGPELPAGKRSVAFRLTFRSVDRTLRDPEVDDVETRMLAMLKTELGILRREGGPRVDGE
jgi:phenylalanyl-tRNA synthetase beta chain